MRNLKKLLALVLAMVMACSLMLSASATNYDDYPDKDSITEEFQEAVAVLTGLDVLKGDDGGFRPSDTLTRAEAAVIVYRVATGDVNDNQTGLYADYGKFSDVKPEDWFAGYVGYCQNAGYIKGTTPTTFTPYEKVTGYQLLAMLLRVVGYGQNEEFVGNSWQVNVAALAEQLGITSTVKEANFASTLNMPARRDVVAELTFKTMNEVPTVTYTPALAYNDKTTTLGQYFNPTLGQKTFGLWKDTKTDKVDNWGRPGYYWVKNGSRTGWTADLHPEYSGATNGTTRVAEIAQTADATFTKRVAECDIAEELGLTASRGIEKAYIDGALQKNTDASVTTDLGGNIGLYDTTSYVGGNGRLLEVYKMDTNPVTYRLVEINTYLARVDKVTPEYTDVNGHKIPAYATLTVFVKSGDRTDSRRNEYVNSGANGDWMWDDEKTTFYGVLNNAGGTTLATRTDTSNNNQVEDARETAGATLSSITSKLLYTEDVENASSGYVLVTASSESVTNGKVDGGRKPGKAETVKPAKIVSGGVLSSWTVGAGLNPGTTTVGNGSTSITYKDADKFVFGRRTAAGEARSIALDDYGNIIGRVNLANYLVIEKIEWKHGSGIGDGYALADVILANGNKEAGVKVSYVNNTASTNCGDKEGHPGRIFASAGDPTNEPAATVSDYYQNNKPYYNHAFAYSVNSDGTYSLDMPTDDATGTALHVAPTTNPIDAPTTVDIVRGQATITASTPNYAGSVNNYVATDNTVFLVLNKDGYTYTTYVGKNNVPTMRGVNACLVFGGNGFVSLAIISGTPVSEGPMLAYVANDDVVSRTSLGVGYNVYPLGSTTAKTVYVDNAYASYTYNGPGIYEFYLNSEDQVIDSTSAAPYNVKKVMHDVQSDGAEVSYNQYDSADHASILGTTAATGGDNNCANIIRTSIKGLSGNSLQTQGYRDYGMSATDVKSDTAVPVGTANADFNVDGNTKVIRVVRYNTNGTAPAYTEPAYLTEGTVSDLAYAVGKVVFIEFDSVGANSSSRLQAKTVYLLEIESAKIGADVSVVEKTTWTLSSNIGTVLTKMNAYYKTNGGTDDDALVMAKNNTIKLPLSYFNTLQQASGSQVVVSITTDTFGKACLYTNASAVPSKAADLVDNSSSGTFTNAGLGVGSRIVIEGTDAAGVNYYTVIEITAG